MRKIFLSLMLSIASLSFAFSQSMDWQYATRFGGDNYASSSGFKILNHPHNLEIDNEGNAYIFGTFGPSGTFYDYPNDEPFQLASWGGHNCGSFVAKFDCNGNVVWHKPIARVVNNDVNAQYMILKDNRLYLQGTVHIDHSNPIYFLDSTVYGTTLEYYYVYHPDSLVFPWIPYKNYTYIMELDLDGNIVDYNIFEMEQRDSTNHIVSKPLWIAKDKQVPFTIDSRGNYYMLLIHTYDITNRENFVIKHNNIPITDTLFSNTYNGYYILKVDHNFNFQYIKPITECVHNPYWSILVDFYDMECDSEDNIYFAGYIQIRDTATNPTYPYDVELADDKHIYIHNIGRHGFVMKMNSSGEILWANQARNYGIYGKSDFQNMLLDENSGNLYVSGFAMPIAPLYPGNYTVFGDNDTLVNNYSGEYANYREMTYIIACYDTEGNYKSYSCPLTYYCTIGDMAIHQEKLYATTRWISQITCRDSVYYPSMQGVNGYSVCEWDLQGNMTDIKQIYCTATAQNKTEPYDTRVNALGEIYTAGRFDNVMAFGEDTIVEHFDTDMFIAKFGLPCQTYIYDTATYCYGEMLQDITLTASGDYTLMYPEGDSVVFVHATVLPPLIIGLNDTTVCTAQQFYLDACGDFDSYQWSTGGTGCTEMLQFDNACTQSVTLTVTRGECSASKTISITAQVCDGITAPVTTAMSLYPNPASDMVTIFGDGFVSATVIDISGRTLLRTTAMQLDISG
ncbi:MAG: hypothetical protein J6W06_04035, partial [Bacteroidales bacterium]|nr:hypothetical protein [Bacteroidales bacterium]